MKAHRLVAGCEAEIITRTPVLLVGKVNTAPACTASGPRSAAAPSAPGAACCSCCKRQRPPPGQRHASRAQAPAARASMSAPPHLQELRRNGHASDHHIAGAVWNLESLRPAGRQQRGALGAVSRPQLGRQRAACAGSRLLHCCPSLPPSALPCAPAARSHFVPVHAGPVEGAGLPAHLQPHAVKQRDLVAGVHRGVQAAAVDLPGRGDRVAAGVSVSGCLLQAAGGTGSSAACAAAPAASGMPRLAPGRLPRPPPTIGVYSALGAGAASGGAQALSAGHPGQAQAGGRTHTYRTRGCGPVASTLQDPCSAHLKCTH